VTLGLRPVLRTHVIRDRHATVIGAGWWVGGVSSIRENHDLPWEPWPFLASPNSAARYAGLKFLGIDLPVAELTAAAPLPAGRQAASQRNRSCSLVKIDGMAEQ